MVDNNIRIQLIWRRRTRLHSPQYIASMAFYRGCCMFWFAVLFFFRFIFIDMYLYNLVYEFWLQIGVMMKLFDQ